MAAMRHVVLMMLIAASVLLCIVAADSLDDEYKGKTVQLNEPAIMCRFLREPPAQRISIR